jgi:hypothetical protein
VAERELVVARQLVRGEPGELGDVVGGPLRATDDASIPGQAEDGSPLVAGLHPDADERLRLDLEAGLLAQLANEGVQGMLVLLEEAAGKVPQADARLERPPPEEEPAVALDERLHRGRRVRPDDVAARRAIEAIAEVLALDATARAEPPAVEDAHGGTVLPVPRHVPATVHELTRVGLLSGLPGEHLSKLAARLEREDIAPGATVVREGEPGDRFYIVLSGMLNVSQEGLGERRILRPGDAFGEVALAMGIPRTASVRAVTPAVVASCDQAAFDELLRPIFADE